MYNFIDVNEVSEGNVLPSEALKINGEYIENLISGYRTLNVAGREALSPDVTSYTTGIRDGSKLKHKRYPERIIIVTYQLIAESNEAFREAYNQLGKILDVEEAELIFNDEQDKFYIGTPCIIGEVNAGANSVKGKFEILCTDPFKYSVYEHEVMPSLDDKCFLIDYKGTYKAFPTLEASFHSETDASDDGETAKALTGAGDCGYVAFFNENEKIIQLGDPEEADKEKVPESQTLVNSSFNTTNSWGSAAKSQWKTNVAKSSPLQQIEQNGALNMGVAQYSITGSTQQTHAQILSATSKADAPIIHYYISVAASERTANSVKVLISIDTRLDKDASYFGNGYELQGSLYIGGKWYNRTLKKTSDYWRGKSSHIVVFSVVVTGLSDTATTITGVKFKVTRPDGLGNAGKLSETACSNVPIHPYYTNTPASHYLTPSSYGTGTAWHGVTITRTIPADAAGDVGAINGTFNFQHRIGIGTGSTAQNQLGIFRAMLISGSGSNRKVVASANIVKNMSGTKANLVLTVNEKHTISSTLIDLSGKKNYYNTIQKFGNKVSFDVCGFKTTFTNDEIADVAITEITISFAQYGTKPTLAANGLTYARFIKANCNTWKNVPNKFAANDVVEADCKNGEIYLNGVSNPALGALGNDWEDFYLTPGLNQIGFSYSDWVSDEYAPTFKMRYREVFL